MKKTFDLHKIEAVWETHYRTKTRFDTKAKSICRDIPLEMAPRPVFPNRTEI